jgi:hypothetical protein
MDNAKPVGPAQDRGIKLWSINGVASCISASGISGLKLALDSNRCMRDLMGHGTSWKLLKLERTNNDRVESFITTELLSSNVSSG